MANLRTLICFFSITLCICCTVATSQEAIDDHSDPTNKATVGGDEVTDFELAIGGDVVVRKKPGRTRYGHITLSADAIEYGLIAALLNGDDFDATEEAMILAILMEEEQAQSTESYDKVVRKRPGRVAEDVDLGEGDGNVGSGKLRNNDPIPGIDVIVDKDPVLNEPIDNSPVMMLYEMLRAGYSQAEVVDFALATGLIGP